MFTGWITVERSVDIPHDLETTSFNIRTDSAAESGKKIQVKLETAGKEPAGTFLFNLISPPQVKLNHCFSHTDLPSIPPSEKYNVWQLRKLRGPRITVLCNGVKVLDVTLSDDTCTESKWNEYWTRDVKLVHFGSDDTASDSYKSAAAPGIKVLTICLHN